MKIFALLHIATLISFTSFSQNWQLQFTAPGVEFNHLNFTDQNTGYAFGDSSVNGIFIKGLVLKTTDHGATWSELNFGSPNNRIFNSCILNGTEIYAAGRNAAGGGNSGLFVKSMDAGNTWSNTSIFSERLFSIGFNTSSTGWVGGKNGFLSATSDGGSTWSSAINLTSEDVLDIEFFNSQTGLIACGGGELFRTTNGGITWTLVNSATGEDLNSISIFNNECWIAGAAGTVIYSSDQGNTFSLLNTGTPLDLFTISFYDSVNGFAAGPAGFMINSANGGGSFAAYPSNCAYDISSMKIINGNSGWFCNIEGEIFTLDNPTSLPPSVGDKSHFVLTPNPAINMIKISGDLKVLFFNIYDILGNKVMTNQYMIQQQSVDISNLKEGVYFIEIVGETQSETKKFIKG